MKSDIVSNENEHQQSWAASGEEENGAYQGNKYQEL